MYTDGEIWAVMLRRKVFRLEDIVKDLNPPKELYGWVKGKVRSLITSQLKLNILYLVVENPPIYATEDATSEDIRKYQKTCIVCGKQFFPKQHDNIVCSQECRREYYKVYHKNRRAEQGARVGTKKRWTEEELKLIEPLLYRRSKRREIEMIAREIKRSKWAVREQIKNLRRRRSLG